MKRMNALIPARGGSKGVPKKNIKLLGPYPLIAYSIKACLDSKLIENIYVSTDDEEIATVAKQYGAQVPFIRPPEYAQDNSTDNEVLNHFFDYVDCEEIAFIRPTTPIRNPGQIDKCITEYYNSTRHKCTGIRSVHELPESPYKMYRIGGSGYCEGFFEHFEGEKNYINLPRQLFPDAYHPNGYIDIIKRSQVRTKNTFGNKVLPFITDFSIEIDTQDQFDLLELYLQKAENDKN